MSKLYSDSVIAEVLDRSNIVELISSFLPLKRAGRNYKTNCPFHPEKTASFIISADKQIFHCFGCGKGGSTIDFTMVLHGITFTQAVLKLMKMNVLFYHNNSPLILFCPILQYSISLSMHTYFLPHRIAAKAVVHAPAALSKIKSPLRLYVLIRYSNRGTGFCVG